MLPKIVCLKFTFSLIYKRILCPKVPLCIWITVSEWKHVHFGKHDLVCYKFLKTQFRFVSKVQVTFTRFEIDILLVFWQLRVPILWLFLSTTFSTFKIQGFKFRMFNAIFVAQKSNENLVSRLFINLLFGPFPKQFSTKLEKARCIFNQLFG